MLLVDSTLNCVIISNKEQVAKEGFRKYKYDNENNLETNNF